MAKPTIAERELIGRFGLYFEMASSQRVTGMIVGWLLICDPPHQSITELAGQQLYLEVVSLPTLEQLQLDDTDLTSPTPWAAVAKLGRSTAERQALFDSLTKHSGYQVVGR